MHLSSDHLPAALLPLAFDSAGTSAQGAAEITADRERAVTQGYAAGFAAGMRAATDQAHQQRDRLEAEAHQQKTTRDAVLHHAVDALGAAADAFHKRTLSTLVDVDAALIESALSIAEAVVGSELRQQEHAAAAALRRSVGELDRSQIRAVRMHPDTLAAIPTDMLQRAEVSLIPDHHLAPGDAVADLNEGFIDARISTALQRCKTALASSGGHL